MKNKFAARLKQLRKEKDITQPELGKILSLDKSTISLYESGKRNPDYDTLYILADYFNCTIDYLLGRSANRKPTDQDEEKEPSMDEYITSASDLGNALVRIAELDAIHDLDDKELRFQ